MIRAFFMFAALVTFAGCASPQTSETPSRLVQNIRNSDIQWHGNIVGLDPHINGVSKQILNDPKVSFDDLVRALEDEQRFVAAHVLLSIRSRRFRISPEQFNGLRVELLADGAVVIPADQQATLIKQWTAWGKAKAENP